MAKLKEMISIHQWIRDSSNGEVFLVTLLVFPFIGYAYYGMLSLFGIDDYLIWFLAALLLLLVVAIIVMKKSQTNKEKMGNDWEVIKNHSKSFETEYIGFDTLKKKNKRYTRDYLEKMTHKYPSKLIIAKFDNNTREGVKILNYSQIIVEGL